ncbi:Uncharacterized protein HZ326_20130 [Fusarium oxysporum f. sp. albedinis]|nr:Uncharacterized protein HZ326_20130 [Fusarium oxysporum f. sp. albedinis]
MRHCCSEPRLELVISGVLRTRSIFGWLRFDGYARHEEEIWKHEWFDMSDSDEDNMSGDETTSDGSPELLSHVESWLSGPPYYPTTTSRPVVKKGKTAGFIPQHGLDLLHEACPRLQICLALNTAEEYTGMHNFPVMANSTACPYGAPVIYPRLHNAHGYPCAYWAPAVMHGLKNRICMDDSGRIVCEYFPRAEQEWLMHLKTVTPHMGPTWYRQRRIESGVGQSSALDCFDCDALTLPTNQAASAGLGLLRAASPNQLT